MAEKHVTQLLLFSAMCSGQKGVERGGGGVGCGRGRDRGWMNSGHNWELLWPEECRETNPTVSAGLCSVEACFSTSQNSRKLTFLKYRKIKYSRINEKRRGRGALPGLQSLVKIEVLFGWETKYQKPKRIPRHSQLKKLKSLYYYGWVKLTY